MWSKKKFNIDNKDLTVYNEKVHIKHYFNEKEDQNKYQREKLYLQDFRGFN
jgi:adenine-specific DNA-methyltransferase